MPHFQHRHGAPARTRAHDHTVWATPSVTGAHRKHVGPVRYAFARFLVPVVVFGAVVVGFARVTG